MSIYIDPTFYHGRPADCTGRLEREVATYDLLDALGIQYRRLDHEPTAPGFAAVDIVPGPDSGLEQVSAHYDSVRGLISVAWDRQRITVAIPDGLSATLRLPGREAIALPSGESVWAF